MDVSKGILYYRKLKGLKQADIADLLEIERSNYARLESRGNKITVEQLVNIAKALNVSVLDIISQSHESGKTGALLESGAAEIQNKLKETEDNLAIHLNYVKAQQETIKLLQESNKAKEMMLEVFAHFAAPFIKDIFKDFPEGTITPDMALKLVAISQTTNEFLDKNQHVLDEFNKINEENNFKSPSK